MTAADLVAVATVGSTLDVLTDFTSDREARPVGAAGAWPTATARPSPPVSRRDRRDGRSGRRRRGRTATDETRVRHVQQRRPAARAEGRSPTRWPPIEQKKAIVYFSAGMARSGERQPGGAARGDQRGGARQRLDLSGRHARAAGGRARRRRARRPAAAAWRCSRARGVGAAVRSADRVAGHADRRWRPTPADARSPTPTTSAPRSRGCSATSSAYYLIGYSQHQRREGRPLPPHQRARVTRRGAARRARAPATTPTAISRTPTGSDREAQLEEQLDSPVSATDLPVIVSARAGSGWRPIATTCRSRSPSRLGGAAAGRRRRRDDRRARRRARRAGTPGRAHPRDDVAAGCGADARRQAGAVPDGRRRCRPDASSVKVVVRENANGDDRLVRERRSSCRSCARRR